MAVIKSGTSLADAVFEQLEASILSGERKKGEILTELRLSKELNVSRTPIREAIRRLEQEKLVEELGKGVRIVGVSEQDLADIYEIRSCIEGLAAKKCAEVITDEQLKQLEDIIDLQEFYTKKAIPENISNTDTEFHKKIYEFCGSDVYSYMLSELHKKAQMYRKMSVKNTSRAACAQKEHRAILEALRNHDGKTAERLAVEHILNARENILNHISSEEK